MPLYNHFWESGQCRLVFGSQTKMVEVMNGGCTNTDRSTMQRLCQFTVVYFQSLVIFTIPHAENMNKIVKIRMEGGSQTRQPYKF